MADILLSRKEIEFINSNKRGELNQIYAEANGAKYIGLIDGSLRALDVLDGDTSGTTSTSQVDSVGGVTAAQISAAVGLAHVSGSEIMLGDVTGTVNSNTVGAVSPGIVDHGGLLGLADDDHLQYLTNARADARYLLLDCSNDPLTNTLDGLNFDFTGTGQIDTSLTVGTGTATDGILRYHSTGVLVYNIGWDEANTALIISEDLFDGSDDRLSFTDTETVFNDSAQNRDLRIESQNTAQLFLANSGNDAVTIGGDLSVGIFNVSGITYLTDKLIFTQTDGDEYIDSLLDGELDIEGTTSVNIRISGKEEFTVDTNIAKAIESLQAYDKIDVIKYTAMRS